MHSAPSKTRRHGTVPLLWGARLRGALAPRLGRSEGPCAPGFGSPRGAHSADATAARSGQAAQRLRAGAAEASFRLKPQSTLGPFAVVVSGTYEVSPAGSAAARAGQAGKPVQ